MNAKPTPLNYDHLNTVLDDARERWLEKEREANVDRPSLVLVKDSSKDKEGVL